MGQAQEPPPPLPSSICAFVGPSGGRPCLMMMEFDLKSKGQRRLLRTQSGTAWWMALHSVPHSGTRRVSFRANGEARGKPHRKGHFSPLLSFYSMCYLIKMHILRTARSTQLKSLNIHSDTEEKALQIWELKEQMFRVGEWLHCVLEEKKSPNMEISFVFR